MKVTSALLAAQAMSRITNLSPDEVAEALQKGGAVVVDIREREEIAQTGTIPGAIQVPRGVLEFSVDPGSPTYLADLTPNRPTILVCDSGLRSALATETLKSLGFTQVAHLHGGLNGWIRQGLPLTEVLGNPQ